jgi:ABC-type multidrug transport system ATPase subunit
MSEAEKLCDRIAIIHRGKIHACDTLANLRTATGQHYLEAIFVFFVQRAIQSPNPSNAMPAAISEAGTGA